MRFRWPKLSISLLAITSISESLLSGASWKVATWTDGAFHLYSAVTAKSLDLPVSQPVGAFSAAPNGHFLVYASKDGRHGMGHLYRLDTATGKSKKLTAAPVYFRNLQPGDTELYSDPEISPDGRSVAFAVHVVSNDDSDDAVGLSGPIAVMALDSGRVRVLDDTRDINGQGPCFANTLRWSPDGKRILFACESTGGIVNARRKGLLRLSSQLRGPADQEGSAVPAGWLSHDEVLYSWVADSPEPRLEELLVLNLRSGKTEHAAPRLHLPASLLENLVSLDITRSLLALQRTGRAEVLTRTGTPTADLPRSVTGLARLLPDAR